MSHDPNNKDCLRNYLPSDFNILLHDLPDCTCPPAVDEVEQIRKRNSFDSNIVYVDATPENPSWIRTVHDDRATLLRIVDQQRAELAAAQSELERLNELKTYCQHDASCQGHNQISPCNCGLSALQEPTE